MRRKFKPRWILLLVVAGLLLAGWVVWRTVRPDPIEEEVARLVMKFSPFENRLGDIQIVDASIGEVEELVALGPKAFPYLAQMLRTRDSAFDRFYTKVRPRLPVAIQRRMRVPQPHAELHNRLAAMVSDLGPAAARALTSVLCENLAEADLHDHRAGPAILRALEWSLPESPQARAALDDWLRKPAPGKGLFGDSASYSLWPKLPQTAPPLISWLNDPDVAWEAANALASIGPAAAAAIPSLIEVADQGVAGKVPNLKLTISYSPDIDPIIRTRAIAIGALGSIGKATPEVLAVLDRGLTSTNEAVRFAALRAMAKLKQDLTTRLPVVLASIPPRCDHQFCFNIDFLGKLGNSGRAALPWLRQFTSLEANRRLPAEYLSPEELRLTAIIAICRIAPDETKPYLPELIAQLGPGGAYWAAVELLTELKPQAGEIIPLLLPIMRTTEDPRAHYAAYIILGLGPNHREALDALRLRVTKGTLLDRVFAASWLYKRTGETKGLFPLLEEGVKAQDYLTAQIAVQTLALMGSDARPAVPALKAALWHKRIYVRKAAGRALQQIAPEEMPPIR